MKTEGIPTPAQAQQFFASEEGRRLMELLSQDGGKGLRRAAEEFRKGNVSGAQEALRPALSTPEAAELLKKINRK